MGRAAQPIDLLEFKGKKNLTKKEIADRKSREIKVAADKVKPPSYLPKDLKKDFKKIANELMKVGIMTNLDIDALARFLFVQKEYLRVTAELAAVNPVERGQKPIKNDEGEIIGYRQYEVIGIYADLLPLQDKLFKQCRNAASDLGLTISSRCRLVMPKAAEKEKSAEEEMYGDV